MASTYERVLPDAAKNNATRVMVSGVLMNEDLGHYLHGELCVPTLRVVAPSPGIDLVVVARYAAWALRVRLRREIGLAIAALLTVALTMGMFPNSLGAMIQLVASLLLAAWVWQTVMNHRLVKRAAAVTKEPGLWDPGPALVSEDREAYLTQVNAANVSIYSRQRKDPFPGLGENVGDVVMPPVNIAKAKNSSGDIVPFDPSDLHDYLVTALPKLGFEDIDARNVIYIAGDWVRDVGDLLPSPNGSPALQVPSNLIRQVADEPRDRLRAYMRAQLVRHGGSLVTSINVRIRIVGNVLSWDVVSHILGPINDSYRRVALLPSANANLIGAAMRLSERNIVLGLAGAPFRAFKYFLSINAERRVPHLDALRKSERRDPYGAMEGEREFAGYGADLEFDQKLDAKDQFQRLFTAVYRAVVTFLDEHHVDVSELVKNEFSTINNTVNNVFGNVQQATFGPNSSATMNNSGTAAAGASNKAP